MKKAFQFTALFASIAIWFTMPLPAQDVNWTVVLNASGTGECEPLTDATVNGQPYDLSKGAGLSMEICPSYYINSSQNGYIFIQMPPDQPWNPSNSWYAWFPSPYTTPSQITRGTLKQIGTSEYFREVDTFTYEYDLTFYSVWPQKWNGTLVQTQLRHPCTVRYCHDNDSDDFFFTNVDSTVTLTGTFPVPTPPTAPSASQLSVCGSDRHHCIIPVKCNSCTVLVSHPK